MLEQVRVAVPDPETLAGVMDPQVSPLGTVSVRDTVPVKPLTAVIVMVEVADWPALTAAGDVAATVKSTKVKVALVACIVLGPVPVIVSEYVTAAAELHVTVAVCGVAVVKVRLLGVIVPQVNPVRAVSVRTTVPVKLLDGVTVIVEVAECPASAVGEVADIEKSAGTPNVNVAVTL